MESKILRAATAERERDSCNSEISALAAFYAELREDRLKLHFDMFRDICLQRKLDIRSVYDIVEFLRTNTGLRELLSELTLLLRLFLTIPITTCSAERSFSVLRRLKTYLRSTLSQTRLNHLSVLHCYQELVDRLQVDDIYKEFVSRNEQRQRTFAI